MQGAQENGITGTTTSPINPNFLPAQENKDYDPRQWALTTTETTHEITREPPPEDRKRLPGCPAFLKPSFASNNLSSALTILHSVPRARSALLCRDHVLPDYGRNSRWWNGEKIRSSRIIDIENERLGFGEAEEEMSEVQRLIAFLDSTDRAYGSVDVLSDMPRVRENEQTGPSPRNHPNLPNLTSIRCAVTILQGLE